MRGLHRLRGLGQTVADFGALAASAAGGTSCGSQTWMKLNDANIELCSGPLYWTFPPCWACSHSAWQQAAMLNPNLLVAKVTPSADLTPEQLTGAAPIDPSAQAAAGYNAGMEQIRQQVQNQPSIGYDCTDLTQVFSDFNNFVATCDTTALWVGGGVALVVLLLLVKR